MKHTKKMILLTFILLKLSYITKSLPMANEDEKELIDFIPDYAKADGILDKSDTYTDDFYEDGDDFESDDDLSGDFTGEEVMADYVNTKRITAKTEEVWKHNLKKKDDLYQGDIHLDGIQKLKIDLDVKIDKILPDKKESLRSKRAARSSDPQYLWKHNTVYYKIDGGFSRSTKMEIKRGIKHWKKTMKNCLKFIRIDKNEVEKNISRDFFAGRPVEHILFTKTSTGCWSQVGRTDTTLEGREWILGQQIISVDKGCGDRGTIIHEIGHAIGFWHEQSRRDRDSYIRIMTNNILPGQDKQFDRVSKHQSNSMGYAYDFWSIMHYGPTFFSKNGRPTIKIRQKFRDLRPSMGQRNALSYLDIAQVRAMYKCNILPSKESTQTCINKHSKGRDYRGELDYTEKGIMCQPWHKEYPHTHNTDLNNSEDGLGKHNYCRNPGGKRERPWCYTTQKGEEWQYCDLKECNS